MTVSTLRNTPAVRFFKTPLALSVGRGGDHRASLLIGFTVSGRAAEIVSARITSPVDPHGVAAPSWLMSMVEADEVLAATLVAEATSTVSDHAEAA